VSGVRLGGGGVRAVGLGKGVKNRVREYGMVIVQSQPEDGPHIVVFDCKY